MNLIYTFDVTVNEHSKHKMEVLKNLYINSILSAKKLGYTTEIYTNCNWFDAYVDIKHIVLEKFEFWDIFKIIPLNRTDDYILVDGDILFHNRFPILDNSVDMYFDGWESWITLYDDGVKELCEMGLDKVIPEWKYEPQRVINIGILRIHNNELKKIYLDRWNTMHEFCKTYKNKFKYFDIYGTLASQYLLTLLSKDYNIKHISNRLGINNGHYTHFVGSKKYKSNPISIQKTLL